MVSESTNSDFWKDRKVCVTGGDGFLGSYVLEKLSERGATQIFVPKIEEYNIVEHEAVKRLLADANPDLILHLAANVGGIGANQARPAEFFYDNLIKSFEEVNISNLDFKHIIEKRNKLIKSVVEIKNDFQLDLKLCGIWH